jgi:hypothetical protein
MIPEEDLNTQTMIAVCPHCEFAFDISDLLPASPAVERILHPPQGFNVREQAGGVIVTYNWFNWRAPVFLAAALSIMGVPFLLLDVIGGADVTVSTLLLLSLCLISLFAIGMIYYSLAQFMNTTRITINAQHIEVRHTPVPMPGNVRLAAEDVTQVTIEEHRRDTEYGTVFRYDVDVLLNNGTQRTLVRGLQRREQARYLEQQLRRYLKLSSQSNRLVV